MKENVNGAEMILFAKNSSRMITRLVDVHTTGKMTDELFIKNLKVFQEAVNNKIDKLMAQDKNIILNDNFKDVFNEFLEQKQIIKPQTQLFSQFSPIKQKIQEGDFDDLEYFIKMNKQLLKDADNKLEERLKIHKFINFALKDDKMRAIEFIRNSQISPNDIDPWLPILISDEQTKTKLNEKHTNVLFTEYRNLLLYIKGVPKETRLVTRIIAGILSINTTKCNDTHRKMDCPTCVPWIIELSQRMPQSKKETTYLICLGTGKKMDEENRALLFKSRWVYSEEYLKRYGYIVYCEKTGKYLDERPKKIFFL
ncbi:hypothetical protein M153_40890001130 [Pseudoloma neurophilia]|uniref:CTLH domain-containing protein n=1 Tax=Pseudoloma neurophilia TaxID=146866 RepID=A0A0R0LZH0_9MICR|nr:hypothetical protein M153_40890001130 [Pseudoloma neurophilia]